MRMTRTIMLAMSVAALLPADLQAQTPRPADAPLAGLIPWLFDQATINETTNVNHTQHFFLGDSVTRLSRQLNVALAAQLASSPLASSSGGFSFTRDDRGDLVPTSTNFGPSFAERGVTIGRQKFNFGFTFQHTSYNSFEGVDLDTGELNVVREHNNCCPVATPPAPPANDPDAVSDGNPAFERDLLRSRLQAEISTNTTALFANYGVTDRFDLGLAVPIVNVKLDARIDAEILPLGSGSPSLHVFSNGRQTIPVPGSGSASGLGDMLVRAKYNFFRTDTAALAAALDLRLPTGDKDNLLGTGATQSKFLFVGSGEYGRFSPHVNFGYTFSSGETSEAAVSVDDPRLVTLPGGAVLSDIDLTVPDEVNYTMGFSVAAHSRLTVGFDLYGRTLRDVTRFSLQATSYPDRPHAEAAEFRDDPSRGNLNVLLGVVGGKIQLAGTFLLNLTVLFPMSDDGLKPGPTPVIGFDYVF